MYKYCIVSVYLYAGTSGSAAEPASAGPSRRSGSLPPSTALLRSGTGLLRLPDRRLADTFPYVYLYLRPRGSLQRGGWVETRDGAERHNKIGPETVQFGLLRL